MKTYEIFKTNGTPNWDKVAGVDIDTYLWTKKPDISATAQAAWDESGLYIRLTAREKNILNRFAEQNDPVYLDSCLEFFFSPESSDPRYFNFEMNPSGALLIGFGSDRHNRSRLVQPNWRNLFQIAPFAIADGWGITLKIPTSFIRIFFPDFSPEAGKALRCNFYKCGDETVTPHFIAWNPLDIPQPDFHRPEFFGNLLLK